MTAPPIFIVGCPRSGTTLLRNLLRSHPNLTFPRESHFIPGFYRAYGDPRDEREAIRLAGRILALSWIRRWELGVTPQHFASCRSFRELVAMLFEVWAQQDGKPRWGDKTPHYVTQIPTVHELFPEAKIVHIYRDGRDVASSWLRSRLEPANLFTAATQWRSWVRAGRRDGASLPAGSYLEVHYERLVTDLSATMREICAFVGEPYCDEVERINLLPSSARVRALTVSTTEVVAGNIERWRSELSRSDLDLFASVAGDLLAELGYEAAGSARRITAPERAMWRAHHLVVHIGRRLRLARHPVYLRTAWEFRRAAARRRAS